MSPKQSYRSVFIIGLIIDIGSITFQDYGPVHAISSLTLAYFRNYFIRLVSIRGYNIQDFDFHYLNFYRLSLYLISTTIFHHFLLFYFSYLENIVYTLKITFFSAFFTIIILTCSYYIFYKKRWKTLLFQTDNFLCILLLLFLFLHY